MNLIKSLLRSFYYAFRGLCGMILTERNFRIHLTVIIYVMIFAFFYGLDKTQAAVLVLTFFTVPSLELVNTAIENTVDLKTREQNPTARFAKDLAAAAVLFASITAVVVGICLFTEKEKLLYAVQTMFTMPWLLIILVSLIPAFLFIRGGKKDKKYEEMKKGKK